MTDQAACRRMRMLDLLRGDAGGCDLTTLAHQFGVDDRTIRRDIDYLQDVVGSLRGMELRRGRVFASRSDFATGYFTDQMTHNRPAKEAIARAVVERLGENQAVLITAGSTTYFVAREIRRAFIEEERPRSLIAFTNSLPALNELITAGVPTGVVGEVFNVDDCAFHSHEFRTAFQPSLAIVGASGVVPNPAAGTLDLYSHRAEEAAFLKQLLAPVPELWVAVDASKLGHRHPWSFTNGGVLVGKQVRLHTSCLSAEQRAVLDELTQTAGRAGCSFSYFEAQT